MRVLSIHEGLFPVILESGLRYHEVYYKEKVTFPCYAQDSDKT